MKMLEIAPNIWIDESAIELSFITSPGPGGQNVNKVATAVQLRFDVIHSGLPANIQNRLIMILGNRLTKQGELLIKASRYRTQDRNKQDALSRLSELIKRAATPPKKRRKTKPSAGSIEKRIKQKKVHGKKKALRKHSFED